MSFINLFEQTYSIRSLVTTRTWIDQACTSIIENFCSIMPHHIKHLGIDIEFMNNMEIILDRLEHL